MWDLYRIQFYLNIKNNKIMTFAGRWMQPKYPNVKWNKLESESKYLRLFFLIHVRKINWYRTIYNIFSLNYKGHTYKRHKGSGWSGIWESTMWEEVLYAESRLNHTYDTCTSVMGPYGRWSEREWVLVRRKGGTGKGGRTWPMCSDIHIRNLHIIKGMAVHS